MAVSFACLKELHSLSLPNQANVYSLAILNGFLNVKPCGTKLREFDQTLVRDKANIIVASLRKPVYLFNFNSSASDSGEPRPVQHEIPFTYIPHQAEIIALDAFHKSSNGNMLSTIVIGIAIIKSDENGCTSQYLNVYSDYDMVDREAKLESLALNCFSIQLGFIPYQLYHCDVTNLDGESEIVWLISGSDNRIHLFVENQDDHIFGEQNLTSLFPELDRDFPSIVLKMDVMYDEGKLRRYTACGCECGRLFVFLTTSGEPQLLSIYTEDYSSPVTCVRFFRSLADPLQVPEILRGKNVKHPLLFEQPTNLLVTISGSASLVLRNVSSGLSNAAKLPASDAFDIVTCGCVGDVTMDGSNEIILGTYGQTILCYRLSASGNWDLLWEKTWSCPILAIHYCDVTGDGVKELVVLTTNGVQILQHDPEEVSQIITHRLQNAIRSLGQTQE